MEQLLPNSQMINQQHLLSTTNQEDHKTSVNNDSIASVCDDNNDGIDDVDSNSIKFKDWGLKVDRLFEVAYRFYKRNESKAFHPTFDTRNQMNALILQARYGNFDGVKAPDVGILDLVGKNRRHQWSLLKGMSKTEAMSKFILALDEICPLFKVHAEAVKISTSNTQNINSSDQNHWPISASTGKDSIGGLESSSSSQVISVKDQESDDQLKAIRTSLYRQTYGQFKSYAEKQYPDDIPKRKYLISTLQEQYYQQYISQMHPEISNNNKTITTNAIDYATNSSSENSQNGNNSMQPSPSSTSTSIKVDSSSNEYNCSEQRIKDTNETKTINNNTEHLQSITETSGNKNMLHYPPKEANYIDKTPQPNLPESEQQNRIQCEKTNEFTHEIPLDNPSFSLLMQQQVQPQAKFGGQDYRNNEKLSTPEKIESSNNNNKLSDNYQQQQKHPSMEMFQQSILPQNIGKFESYPAPKLIHNSNVQQQQQKQNSFISVAINMFNPVITNNSDKQSQHSSNIQQPKQPNLSEAVNVAEEAIEHESTNKTTSSDDGGVSNGFFQPITITSKEQPLENLPIPFQPLPSPPLPMKPPATEASHEHNDDGHNHHQPKLPPVSFQEASPQQVTNSMIEQKSNYISSHENETPASTINNQQQQQLEQKGQQQVDTWSCGSSDGRGSPMQQNTVAYEPLEPATIWTKKGVVEFRESLMDDKHGGMHVVNQGVLLTIQVPTYPDGRYIQWEFCTEDFDIAFGLDFVYDSYLPYPPSMRIYEETDTEDEEEEEDDVNYNNDIELAGDRLNRITRKEILARKRAEKLERIANTISIVPTYRRESHEEVFVGRHRYPGQGYYLLKFDNTYSVLRSKTLYFRICYLI